MMGYLIAAVLGYLLGSIPTGFLVGCARGLDIRKLGSGNIGATNVFRFLGKTAGSFVLLADGVKGYVASILAAPLVNGLGLLPAGQGEYLALVGGIAAILGHNYTCWLRFKGGKGIATTAGVLLALAPGALVFCLLIWLATFAATRYVSAASIVAAMALPLGVWLLNGSRTMILITAGLGALALYKHKSNIQRLLQGTEHRFGAPSSGANHDSKS